MIPSRGIMVERLYEDESELSILLDINEHVFVLAEIKSPYFGSGKGYIVSTAYYLSAFSIDSTYIEIIDQRDMFNFYNE